MKAKIYLTGIFILAFVCNSFSQHREFEFKNFTQENGLPSNESYFVYRDSKDFLWFATDQGVVRYNGSKMEHFDLPDNVIFKIREDSKGRIWFFSHTGKLTYFFNGTIYTFPYNTNFAKTAKDILIADAYVSDNDDIIINSGTRENYKILNSGVIEKSGYFTQEGNDRSTFLITKPDGKLFFTQRTLFNQGLFDTICIRLADSGREITYNIPWVVGGSIQYGCVTTSGKELFFFNGKGIARLNRDGSFKIKYFPYMICSLSAAGDQIWAGFMKHGAVLLDRNLNELYREPLLKDKSVTSIRSDYEDGIWFSTLEKGIFYLKNPNINHLYGDSTLSGPVFRLYNSDNHYVLYANTTGIYKMDGDVVSVVLRQNSTKVTDLFTDSSKNIYLAGTTDLEVNANGMYRRSNDVSYKTVFVLTAYAEMIPRRKNKYLLSGYGVIHQYTLGSDFRTSKKSNWLFVDSAELIPKPGILFCDFKKQFWLGTNNGLYRFISLSDPLIPFKPNDTLFQKGITNMQQMGNGLYSMGIRFGGIALMKDTSVIARITESEGLLSNSIKYLLPLNDQLWAATAKGISVIRFQSYDPVTYTITNIGKNAGLYNQIIYQLMPYHGNMLAATSNGIYEIGHPEQFLQNLPKPIPFYINSISYYKGDTSRIGSITLPYNNNRVVIKYSAVCFNLPEEIKYQYRFDNSDSNWHEVAATELLMENLIPGTYNLEIKASIPRERRFSGIQKLQVIVEKPWWQNNWLRAAAIIGLAGIIFIFLKRRIDRITRREQENTALYTKMMELEQTALRSQMNPHFIFNCLTSIQQLVVTGNKHEANEYLVKFARLIRKTLELSGRSFISIEEEKDYLNEYLAMEQLRIPGQFEFSIDIDPHIDTQKTDIPNMMLQPIIENSIRHGIKHLDNKKGYIRVSLEHKEPYILCTITDNGVGRGKLGEAGKSSLSENKSYGMNIVNKRLEAISVHDEKESSLEVEDLYDKDGSAAGTKVTLRLPFKTR